MKKIIENTREHLRDAENWLRYSDWGPCVVPAIAVAFSLIALIVNLLR